MLFISGWFFGWPFRQSIGQYWTSSRSAWVLPISLQIPGWHFPMLLLFTWYLYHLFWQLALFCVFLSFPSVILSHSLSPFLSLFISLSLFPGPPSHLPSLLLLFCLSPTSYSSSSFALSSSSASPLPSSFSLLILFLSFLLFLVLVADPYRLSEHQSVPDHPCAVAYRYRHHTGVFNDGIDCHQQSMHYLAWSLFIIWLYQNLVVGKLTFEFLICINGASIFNYDWVCIFCIISSFMCCSMEVAACTLSRLWNLFCRLIRYNNCSTWITIASSVFEV